MRKGKEAEEMKMGEKVERKEVLDKRETPGSSLGGPQLTSA